MKFTFKLQIFVIFFAICIFIIHSPFLVEFSALPNTKISQEENELLFPNQTVLYNGIPDSKFFSNESSIHNWLIENVSQGQVIYLSITPQAPFTRSEFKTNLFLLSGQNFNAILEETPVSTNKFLASWKTPNEGNWIIQVNDTRTIKAENVSYEILVYLPEKNYDERSAIEIYESFYEANFTIDHEIHYWKVSLDENQNGTVFLKETDSTVLFLSKITIYNSINGPQNPILPQTEITTSHNYSWRAFVSDTYFIVIRHNAQGVSPIGSYNISFSAQKSFYNFDTAERLINNKTTSIKITQGYFPAQKFYFWFMVNLSGTDVFIRVYEQNLSTSIILDYAIVEIYDEGRQNRISNANEADSDQDGYINLTLKNLNEGLYFVVITPQPNAIGTFNVQFEYQLPSPFTWNLLAILINIIILIGLPFSFIYLDSTGKWYRRNEWTFPNSLKETYEHFKKSFRGVFNIKEVSEDSILVQVASIPFMTFSMINFIESSEKETIILSKRIRRKIEWIIYFLFSIIVYDVLNFFSFMIFSIHFLPFYFSNISNLLVTLVLPTMLLVLIVLFVNISAYITYNQIINRITYIILNYDESTDSTEIFKGLDPEQAAKGINYVRVLWNQAKHAFKQQNFELFIIKADAAVKNLVATRFMQLTSENTYSKPDFQLQVIELRNRGFDLPNDKKIAYFRSLRNKIVHSSVTLDEKESVDSYAFYSTFISRLGLRPT